MDQEQIDAWISEAIDQGAPLPLARNIAGMKIQLMELHHYVAAIRDAIGLEPPRGDGPMGQPVPPGPCVLDRLAALEERC